MARKTYNEEFKLAAAKLVREQGYTIKNAAESLGVSPGSIRSWVYSHAPALSPPFTLLSEVPRPQLIAAAGTSITKTGFP